MKLIARQPGPPAAGFRLRLCTGDTMAYEVFSQTPRAATSMLNQMTKPARRGFLSLAGGGLAATLPGCAGPDRGPAVPVGRSAAAEVLGVPNERFRLPRGIPAMEQEFAAAMQRLRQTRGLTATAPLPPIQLLSLSGGGENGAFGAGLLCGWSAQGSRPQFELVTGISTGALIAPFAYLGSAHDETLRTVFTGLKPSDILENRWLPTALFSDALADNQPLFRTISRFVDEPLMAAIGAAHGQGRLLLIATTDLDAQVPVIWNVGAIARSGHPRALDTVRRIMLASAAIPGAFPPTLFDVTVDGQPHQELHVDGGAFAQAFLYPSALGAQREARIRRGERVVPASAYIIRNGRLDPEWASIDRRTLSIAGRAIATMITAAGLNDVVRMYNNTQRDNIDFNLAFIGSDFTTELPAPFDQGYMRALFDYGYQRASRGYDWSKRPPF